MEATAPTIDDEPEGTLVLRVVDPRPFSGGVTNADDRAVATIHALHLELPDTWTRRPAVDAVTARALRLALGLGADAGTDAAVADLLAAAHGDGRLVREARARVERALAAEPSRVVARAASLLGAAEARAA